MICIASDRSTESTVLVGLLCTQRTTSTEISIFSRRFLSRSLFSLVESAYEYVSSVHSSTRWQCTFLCQHLLSVYTYSCVYVKKILLFQLSCYTLCCTFSVFIFAKPKITISRGSKRSNISFRFAKKLCISTNSSYHFVKICLIAPKQYEKLCSETIGQ